MRQDLIEYLLEPGIVPQAVQTGTPKPIERERVESRSIEMPVPECLDRPPGISHDCVVAGCRRRLAAPVVRLDIAGSEGREPGLGLPIPQLRRLGIEPQPGDVLPALPHLRFVHVAQDHVRPAQVSVRLGKLGAVYDGQLRLGDRLFRPVVLQQDVGEDIQSDRRRRVERDGSSRTAQRLVLTADGGEQFSVLLVGLGVIRVNFQRPEIVGLRLLPLPAVPRYQRQSHR